MAEINGFLDGEVRYERPALTIELRARTKKTAGFREVGSEGEGEWSVYGPSTPLPPADGECHGARSEATGMSRRGLIAAALAAPFVMRSTPAAAAPAPSIRLLIAGQSLGSYWTHSPAFSAFVRRLRQTGETRPITMLDVAVGGTSALKCHRPRDDGYWWDEDRNRSGPVLRRAVEMIKRENAASNAILWVHGERDSAAYAGTTSAEDMAFLRLYRDAVLAIIATLRSACSPNAPLTIPAFVQRLGPRNGEMDYFRGMPIVRRAQQHVVEARGAGIYWGARPDATIPTRDGLHPTDEGFAGIGEETSEAVRGRI